MTEEVKKKAPRKRRTPKKKAPVVEPVQEEEDDFYSDSVKPMEHLDAERWGRLEAEVSVLVERSKGITQEVKIMDLEEANRRAAAEVAERKLQDSYSVARQGAVGRAVNLAKAIKEKSEEYEATTQALADKYQIERSKMLVDVESYLVRQAED